MAIGVIVLSITSLYAGSTAYQEIREIRYRSELGKYSQGLEPGMSREVVENRLLGAGATFRKSLYSDWIELGRTGCFSLGDQSNVDIVLNFDKRDSNLSKPEPADEFWRIQIYRTPLDCR
jgi:hypothetical protein